MRCNKKQNMTEVCFVHKYIKQILILNVLNQLRLHHTPIILMLKIYIVTQVNGPQIRLNIFIYKSIHI